MSSGVVLFLLFFPDAYFSAVDCVDRFLLAFLKQTFILDLRKSGDFSHLYFLESFIWRYFAHGDNCLT